MAVRAPLFVGTNNDLEEMATSEVTEWVAHICYLYGLSPSVTLTVSSSSAGDLSSITDTRLQAGAASTHASAFVAEGATAEPSTVTVTYDRVDKANASTLVLERSDINSLIVLPIN